MYVSEGIKYIFLIGIYVIFRISLAFVSGPSSFCRNVKESVKKLSHNQSNVKC